MPALSVKANVPGLMGAAQSGCHRSFEDIRDQYLLLSMDWQQDERIESVMIHVRLKDNKLWIEEDWTENGIATDLLEQNITKDEIVLAFHPPRVRQYTEFAVA